MNAATWTIHDAWCQPFTFCTWSTRPESGKPTIDHFSKFGRPAAAMRNISVVKPVTPITSIVERITACSGLVLMRIR